MAAALPQAGCLQPELPSLPRIYSSGDVTSLGQCVCSGLGACQNRSPRKNMRSARSEARSALRGTSVAWLSLLGPVRGSADVTTEPRSRQLLTSDRGGVLSWGRRRRKVLPLVEDTK